MNNEITVTYNAQITRVIKPVDKSEVRRIEAQLMNEDLSELANYIKHGLDADDVKIGEFKVFVRTEDKD